VSAASPREAAASGNVSHDECAWGLVMQLMAAAYRKGFADGDATKAAGVSEPQRAGPGKAHQL